MDHTSHTLSQNQGEEVILIEFRHDNCPSWYGEFAQWLREYDIWFQLSALFKSYIMIWIHKADSDALKKMAETFFGEIEILHEPKEATPNVHEESHI